MSQIPHLNSTKPVGFITPELTAERDLVQLLSDQYASEQIRLMNDIAAELDDFTPAQLDKLLGIIRLCRSIAS